MTEKEKDAFIVQIRGEVTMYRDAYRLAKYQLDRTIVTGANINYCPMCGRKLSKDK